MKSLPFDIWNAEDEPRLGALLDEIWHLLERGVEDRQHGFHTPALATSNAHWGCAVRTVALRGAERGSRSLLFHTDNRSRKIGELVQDRRVALLFYDARENTQLRIDALAEAQTSGRAAERAWRSLNARQRREYLISGPPGLPWAWPTSGLSPDLEERVPDESEAALGRYRFALVTCRVMHIDWLYLTRNGHRRATFAWDEDDRLSTSWLIP